MITIKEIALQLGVSPTTVSNVIHGKTKKMSENTRKKIEEVLVKNHYVRDKNFKNKDDDIKLIIVQFFFEHQSREMIFTDPFCTELFEAISKQANLKGRSVICNTMTTEDDLLKKLSSNNVEGAIVLGYSPKLCQELCKRTIKPIVFIDCGYGDYDNIGISDRYGSNEITSYVIRQGHEKIAFFCDENPPKSSNKERFIGFKEALQKHNIQFKKEDFYYLPLNKNLRYEVLRQFAKNIKQTGYTSAFFVSDLYANEAINIFFSKGIQVPEDISVTGFDDNIYARLSRPTLTTVRQSPKQKGIEAVEMLFKRIYGEDVLVRSIELQTELIVRESVKNLWKR